MKKHKVVLTILLVAIGITAFIGLKSLFSLKEQNNVLMANVDQITKRINTLEKTIEQVSALRAKNIALKKEIEDLKAKLGRIPKSIAKPSSQKAAKSIRKEESAAGNKGFLIKNRKPAH